MTALIGGYFNFLLTQVFKSWFTSKINLLTYVIDKNIIYF